MALSKRIGLGNGVVTNYHRVVSVNTITNVANIIEIASYTSRAKREEEQDAVSGGEPMNIYIHTRYENAPYDQTMTVDDAYEWVKANVSDFEGANDVLDEAEDA